MTTKSKTTKPATAVVDALTGGTVTVAGQTVALLAYADMPRKARRELRNALFKAAPDAASATDKMDVFLAAYDAGVIALRAAGATIDPNDESLTTAEGDALDQTIMLVGLRVLGEMNPGGDSKNVDGE